MITLTVLPSIAVLAESSLTPWPFFVEVAATARAPAIYETIMPLHVLDKAREDLADLRLFDANGREIPYALRIRKEVDEKREIGVRLFNQSAAGTQATEVSVDLGENPGDHNEVEIETTGSNFRRRVDVEGSDSGADWRTLKVGGVIFRFESQNKIAESNRVSYPLSRYRYLRLRVHSDELNDKTAPGITSVKAMMVRREQGLLSTWNVGLPSYQFLRNQGAPASAWTIDLGGRVPCDRLTLMVDDDSFSRPFQVEVVDDPQNIRLVAAGELTRRLNEKPQPLTIRFDEEAFARKLRLLVTDYNNPALNISSITAGAPARQLFFELKEPLAQPLRLFFGNLKATEPHYDFEKELSARLVAPILSAAVGTVVSNPDYRPEPLPFTERVPWLIYVVLTVSSLALGLILFSLARTTMKMQTKTLNEKNAKPR
jgi:hypothetical protein